MRTSGDRRRSNGDSRPYFDAATNRWKVAVEVGPAVAGRRQRKIVTAKTRAAGCRPTACPRGTYGRRVPAVVG